MAIKIFCDLCKKEIIDDTLYAFELDYKDGKKTLFLSNLARMDYTKLCFCNNCMDLLVEFFRNGNKYD